MIVDHAPLTNVNLPDDLRASRHGLIVEYLFNTIKWTIPGLLLLQGCRDRKQMRTAIFCVLALLLLLALQVIRQMPLEYALDGMALQERALRVLDRQVGYHRVDLAMVLAGAPWAFLAARALATNAMTNLGFIAMAGVAFVGLAMTGGRTGYVSWAAAGAVLCALRWRAYLMLAPVAALVVLLALPGTVDRLLQGVDTEALGTSTGSPALDLLSGQALDTNVLTSDRVDVWPYVIQKIKENPFTGYGRRAHQRTGLWMIVYLEKNEVFAHPHNAYLEFTLDNGIIALALVLTFYALVLYKAARLFRDREPLAMAVGGLTIGLVVSFLAACMGAQSLYPTASTVAMWCAMCLTLRLWQIRRNEAAALASPATAPPTAMPAMAAPPPVRPGGVALWPRETRKRLPAGARPSESRN
jgi:O-antigen ligase